MPSFVSLLAEAAGDRYQGAVQGLGSSFGSAAAIVGLLGGGVLYGWLGAGVFWLSALAFAVATLATPWLASLGAPAGASS